MTFRFFIALVFVAQIDLLHESPKMAGTSGISKRIFHETPRYILFGHMLMNDSVLLLVTTIMYAVALCFLPIPKSICTLLVFISYCTFHNAPLTLALMSLERYVAICFPLRHCSIATPKRTGLAIGIIWFLSSINIIVDIIFVLTFLFKWQLDKYQAFDVLYFISVAVIIIFTYISIMITVRSVSSDKDSAKKALKTVLLHLIQLGLCLTSFLTLIYGMRDEAVWPLFKYFFCCRSGKVRPSVNVH
uniref:G-protein coupled receptors family 1 profile domain-containing protein n=1 Tax=Sinocyclocheilus anshuiensis TaxID=1608454 RepID=A0A671RXS5_9TELE